MRREIAETQRVVSVRLQRSTVALGGGVRPGAAPSAASLNRAREYYAFGAGNRRALAAAVMAGPPGGCATSASTCSKSGTTATIRTGAVPITAPTFTAEHSSLHRTGTTTTSACSPSMLRLCDGIDGVVATRVHSHVVRGGGRLIPRWVRLLGAAAVMWYAPGPGVPHAACDILRIDLDRKADVHPRSECQLASANSRRDSGKRTRSRCRRAPSRSRTRSPRRPSPIAGSGRTCPAPRRAPSPYCNLRASVSGTSSARIRGRRNRRTERRTA